MKKYLAICLMLALVSASQGAVIFQEDFSGYTSGGTEALNLTAQVGTFSKSATGLIDVRVGTLMDGSTGAYLSYYDDSGSVNPFVIAETVSYSASPIRITYDFLIRRGTGFGPRNDQAAATYLRQSDGDDVVYIKKQDANTTSDWYSHIATAPGTSSDVRYSKDTWLTMELELPAMPASGAFEYKYTVSDASGVITPFTGVGTKSDQDSYSTGAGAQLIDQLVFTAPGNADTTSVAYDNILIETIPEPATLGLLGSMGVFTLFMRRFRRL